MNVLIVGGSSDIGIALGKLLITRGYKVISTYNNHKIEDNDIDYVHLDVRNEDEIDTVIKSVIDKYGNIDILINLAAISRDNYFLDKSKEEFMSVLEVNLVGTFLVNKIYSKYIDNGLIINISSTDGIDTYSKYNVDYSASKAGVITLSKNMSIVTNNRVLCICPNWIDSDSTRDMDKDYLDNELKRIGQSRLITIDEFINEIDNIINSDYQSGSVIRIDIKGDKIWIKEI